jgi:hypothetical protein
MDKLESIRADLARGLVVRLKRVDHTTAKGNRTGSLPELTAAEKDLERAITRLNRAQMVHASTTAAVREYADALKANGGTPELPEWFELYEARDTNGQTFADAVTDRFDAQGNPTDPEREPEPNNGDDEEDPDPYEGSSGPLSDGDAPQPRPAGRFARRGSVV